MKDKIYTGGLVMGLALAVWYFFLRDPSPPPVVSGSGGDLSLNFSIMFAALVIMIASRFIPDRWNIVKPTVLWTGGIIMLWIVYSPIRNLFLSMGVEYAGMWALFIGLLPVALIGLTGWAFRVFAAVVAIGILWVVLTNVAPVLQFFRDPTAGPATTTGSGIIDSLKGIVDKFSKGDITVSRDANQPGFVKNDTTLFDCKKEPLGYTCTELRYDFGANYFVKGIKGSKIVLNNAEMQAILLPNPADPAEKNPVQFPPVLAFAASKWILSTAPAVPQPAQPAPAPVPAPAPPAATTPATVTPSPAPGVPPAPIAPTMPTEIKAQITDRTFKVTAALGWLYTLRLDDAPTSNKVNIVLVRGGADVFTQEFLPRDKIPNDYFLKNVVDGDTLRVDPIPGLERSFVSPSPEKPYVVKLVPTGKY